MRPTFVLLLAAVALVGATGVVAADGGQNQTGEQNQSSGQTQLGIREAPDQSQPQWPGQDTTTENNTTTGVSPGQQLAGAVGAQGASLQGELWNRTLSERLANATTPAERATVVTDEVALLESSLDALEAVRGNLTEAWDDDEVSEGQYRASLSEFVVRARTVELRANQTARAARRLPESTRRTHDINVTYIWGLGEQAHDLYQFEGEIAQEVVNETLANQSRGKLPGEDEDEDEER